jgi:glycosyltransferase involved in cell wall biosynthesis
MGRTWCGAFCPMILAEPPMLSQKVGRARVSVVIPLFNKATTIRRAVLSVLAQTEPAFELIVVDDGSTDDSMARLSTITDSRLRLMGQDNAGPGAARNAGAAHGTAPLLAFLDADDDWEPAFLSRAVAALERQPECAAFVAAFRTGDACEARDNRLLGNGLSEGPWRLAPDTRSVEIKDCVDACHSSCAVIRRSAFEMLGGFYDVGRCVYGEDSYLWLQVVLNASIYWDPQPLVNFHLEDSALGAKMAGRHPIRPALTDPARLRRNCTGPSAAPLERLLGYYRLIETEKLARKGDWDEIMRLRRLYPAHHADPRLFWRERKVEMRTLLTRFGVSH